jgi:ankyrin repeat protein
VHFALPNEPKTERRKNRFPTTTKRMEEEIDFEQAAKDGDLQAVKRFVASHPNDLNQQLDLFGLTAFNAACKGGQVEVVTYLLGIKGVNYNTPSSTGETPFFNACASKNAYKLVPLLIRANKEIDITTKNNKGMTPLSVAVEKMDLTTVEWILANDKNVDLDVELDTGLKHVGLIGFTAIKSESTANESTR